MIEHYRNIKTECMLGLGSPGSGTKLVLLCNSALRGTSDTLAASVLSMYSRCNLSSLHPLIMLMMFLLTFIVHECRLARQAAAKNLQVAQEAVQQSEKASAEAERFETRGWTEEAEHAREAAAKSSKRQAASGVCSPIGC